MTDDLFAILFGTLLALAYLGATMMVRMWDGLVGAFWSIIA